jgi:hypothetical protein
MINRGFVVLAFASVIVSVTCRSCDENDDECSESSYTLCSSVYDCPESADCCIDRVCVSNCASQPRCKYMTILKDFYEFCKSKAKPELITSTNYKPCLPGIYTVLMELI